MNNRIIFLGIIYYLFSYNLSAQVGINTDDPQSTFEIIGTPNDPKKTDGILIPRVTLGQLNSKNDLYNEPQTGTLIYVSYVGDGIPSGKTEDVTVYGFYYYDYWNSKGQKWKRISDNTEIRKTSVTVGTGKMYTTLQEAFNVEAKKTYDQNGVPVEFLCSGEVGGLSTDGSIPYIKITSDGTMTTYNGGFSFINTSVDLEGKIDMNVQNITTNNSSIVILKDSEIIANGITIDKSSLKSFFGGNKLTLGHITAYNGYVDIEGTDGAPSQLNLRGAENVWYLVSSTRSSYILLSGNLTINCTANSDQSVSFEASYGSTIHCDGLNKIILNNTYSTTEDTYDFRAKINGTVILDACDINGSSVPKFFMASDHQSKMIFNQSKATRTVAKYGLSSITGSTISIIGDQATMSLKGPGIDSGIGMIASNGNINLATIGLAPMVTLEGFNIGIQSSDGGIINAMGRVKRDTNVPSSNIPLTIAVPSKTGAIIYDSETED